MRNDARPIGHAVADKSPTGRHDRSVRTSVTHRRKSHVVNRRAEEDEREDHPREPALPTNDATVKTKI